MCDDLCGLDFPLESIPADLLANNDNDLLRGFGDSELDLDCLLNSNLIDDSIDHVPTNLDAVNRNGHASILTPDSVSAPTVIERVVDVKHEPMATQNQSPVLESLLKSAAVSSPCVNPAPQTSNTSFSPTIAGRKQCVSTNASPALETSNENEMILAALLKRHEEDRKLLDHLVSDLQRNKNPRDRVVPTPVQVPTNIVQNPSRTSTASEKPAVPAQVVVATPVATRPVGIISGTRMFVATPAMECPSPDFAESMDVEDDCYDDEPCRPKTKRRSSHNAIEKRYRLSINMRIDELRTLIDGPDSKLSKSAVLRRAIERIRNIERENCLLRKQLAGYDSSYRIGNKSLTSEVKREIRIIDESESSPEPATASITSPESSLEGSPPLSPQDRKLSGAGAKAPRLAHLLMKHEPPSSALYQAVGSRARICLAGLFLTLFFVNPLVLWDSGSPGKNAPGVFTPGGAFSHGGRSLLEYWRKESNETKYIKWFAFTLISILIALAFLLIKTKSKHSEPSNNINESASSKDKDDVEFLIWRHWKQAEAHISEGSWPRVVTELKSVLIALGQPFPINQWDWCCFATKHFCFVAGLTQEVSENLKPDTIALRYRAISKLLSLSLHGHLHLSFCQRMILTLTLFFGMRRIHLSKEARCQAFINMSTFLPVLRSRLLRYAAESLQTSDGTEIPPTLRWILNPEGYQFLGTYKLNSLTHSPIQVSEFDANTNRINISEGVMVIAFAFRRKLMEEVLELLANKDERRLKEVFELLTLLVEYSSNAELLESSEDKTLETSNGMDHVQHWWSNIAVVTALWQQERWDKSRSFHSVIDSPPPDIRVFTNYRYRNVTNSAKPEMAVNELAQAILLAYRVQRRCIYGPCEVPRPCSHNALKLADEAAVILENNVLGKAEKEKIYWLWCIIASDWLLTSRLSLNQPPNALSGADEDAQIHKFERDLSILQGALKRAGLSTTDAHRRWMVMHQARLRLWRGSHPVRTALTLRRNNIVTVHPDRDGKSDDHGGSNEVAHVREWLQQRLMRPRSGMNGLK